MEEDEERVGLLEMEAIGSEQNLQGFKLIYIITITLGLLFVGLVSIWTGGFLGGFAWTSDTKLEFNWHPLLMSTGMIFLYANSILFYRGYRTWSKRTLKLGHALIHGLIFFLIIIALSAVFDSHNLNMKDGKLSPIPNMYSLHSWVGLVTVILFSCQLLSGFITYLYPGLTSQLRMAYMPIHIFFGIGIFVCATATALIGFSEKAFFAVPNLSDLPGEGILINIMGLCLILFSGLVVYLVVEKSYKRQPLPEDEVLLTSHMN